MQERDASSADLGLPTTIGRYAVVRLVGEGAMGRVLLAHDPVLERDVAVKLLRDDLRVPSDVRDGLVVRMRHEARAAARVAHPNLVTLHDMGEDPSLGLYLVFEYVEGPTLKHRLLDGALSPRQAARLGRELGAALTVAHRAGIVHRDIKPDNVILSATGGKIADFGIARVPNSTLTHQGGLLGTPAYSAPETFRHGKFSPESDQFSLAASLYEAVSGRRAYPGDDAAVVASKIANDEPERFAHDMRLPLAVDDVLARALSKDPRERFGSCEELGDAFARALAPVAARSNEPSLPGAPFEPARADSLETLFDDARGAPPPKAPPPERKTTQVVLGAVVVVVTAGLLLRTALRSSETESEPPPVAPVPSESASSTPAASVKPRASATARASARPRAPDSADPASSAAPAADAAALAPEDAGLSTPPRDAGGADATPATPDGG
ncbi:MAG: serine/threonine-protein kinase [Polyangiaceae bacterium]